MSPDCKPVPDVEPDSFPVSRCRANPRNRTDKAGPTFLKYTYKYFNTGETGGSQPKVSPGLPLPFNLVSFVFPSGEVAGILASYTSDQGPQPFTPESKNPIMSG